MPPAGIRPCCSSESVSFWTLCRYLEQSNLLLEKRNDSFKMSNEQSQAKLLQAEQEKVGLPHHTFQDIGSSERPNIWILDNRLFVPAKARFASGAGGSCRASALPSSFSAQTRFQMELVWPSQLTRSGRQIAAGSG